MPVISVKQPISRTGQRDCQFTKWPVLQIGRNIYIVLDDVKVDVNGRGHLDAVDTMTALRAVNTSLSDADEDFIFTVSISSKYILCTSLAILRLILRQVVDTNRIL